MKRQVLGRLAEVRQWQSPSSASPAGEAEGTERKSMNSNGDNGGDNDPNPTTNMTSGPVNSQSTGIKLTYSDGIIFVSENDEPIEPDKPKRPYLKKGVGLARYNMKREDYTIYNNKCVRKSNKANQTPESKTTASLDKSKADQKISSPAPTQSETLTRERKTSPPKPSVSNETPLRDDSTKTEKKSTHDPLKVLRLSSEENDDAAAEMQGSLQTENLEPLSLPSVNVNYSNEWLGRWIRMGQSFNGDNSENAMTRNFPVHDSPKDETKQRYTDADDIFNASANELQAFETLEKRVDQSSFCSTSSSVMRLINCQWGAKAGVGEFVRNWRVPAYIAPYLYDLARVMDESNTPASSVADPEESSSNTDTTDQEYTTSDLSDYGSRDDQSSSSDSEVSLSNQAITPNVPEFCDKCSAPIRAKIEEYEKEINDLTNSRNNFDAVKDRMESQMLEFEKEVKIKRREIDDMKMSLTEKLQNAEQPPNKENKALQQELAKVKQELASLKIELHETKEYTKVRESSHGVRFAKLRNTIRELEKQNANLKSEIAILTADKNKMIAREQNAAKSAQMNMLRRVANDVTDLKKTTQSLQLEANVSTGAIKKIPVVPNTSEKRKVKKRDNRCNVRELTDEELDDRESDEDRKHRLQRRDSYMKKLRFSSEENLAVPTNEENLNRNGVDEEAEANSIINGSIKKTIFSLTDDDPGAEDPEDDAIIKDILEEILQSYELGDRMADNQQEQNFDDGSKEIRYPNGNIKIITPDCVVRYYYAIKDVWQTHKPEGTEIMEFPSGQRDERGTNKIFHVEYTDGFVQSKYFDYTVVQYLDGSFLKRNDVTGDCVLYMPNGDKEIHGLDFKSRIYSDGTIKTVFVSGFQETRYPNGRVRIKSKTGELILDTFEDER